MYAVLLCMVILLLSGLLIGVDDEDISKIEEIQCKKCSNKICVVLTVR